MNCITSAECNRPTHGRQDSPLEQLTVEHARERRRVTPGAPHFTYAAYDFTAAGTYTMRTA